MTAPHGHTPTDDRASEQNVPGRQPPMSQPQPGMPGQPQPIPQTQPPQQPTQPAPQGQPSPQLPPTQLQQPTQPVGQLQQSMQPVGQLQQPTQPVGQTQQQTQPVGQLQQPQQQAAQMQRSPQPVGQTQQMPQQAGVTQRPQPQSLQEPFLKPLRVSEIITEDVITAETDTPVQTIVSNMAEHNVGSVVVLDDDDRPVGVITDRKVALALEEMPDIAQRPAEELLQGDVFTADPSMNIFDAIQVMSDEGIRRLPIVDDNGALRGIVTLDDALVLLGGVVSDVADTVQSQSPRL